ncbi:early nodulin-like protein 20 [Nicotiana sylvestris]|uniref:Lamin-like protein n=1 Tax=Nicotiana sylvestris TaxID=4096 RepID=A0A1U7W1K0_NICSY|nr:PREDICTED: lamin-like protein [Nicotiana sylvestris]
MITEGVILLVRVTMLLGMIKSVASGLDKVGGKYGWTQNVNYTDWAVHRHFYVGDWLYFVFDKHLYSVLEVNQTNYEQCIDHDFITNITRGGRDVYQLTQARPYYFISSGGYCFHGMKLSINVEQQPSPASPAPSSAKINASPPQIGKHFITPAVAFVVTLVWVLLFARARSS